MFHSINNNYRPTFCATVEVANKDKLPKLSKSEQDKFESKLTELKEVASLMPSNDKIGVTILFSNPVLNVIKPLLNLMGINTSLKVNYKYKDEATKCFKDLELNTFNFKDFINMSTDDFKRKMKTSIFIKKCDTIPFIDISTDEKNLSSFLAKEADYLFQLEPKLNEIKDIMVKLSPHKIKGTDWVGNKIRLSVDFKNQVLNLDYVACNTYYSERPEHSIPLGSFPFDEMIYNTKENFEFIIKEAEKPENWPNSRPYETGGTDFLPW